MYPGEIPELTQRSNLVANPTEDQPIDRSVTPGLIGDIPHELSEREET